MNETITYVVYKRDGLERPLRLQVAGAGARIIAAAIKRHTGAAPAELVGQRIQPMGIEIVSVR